MYSDLPSFSTKPTCTRSNVRTRVVTLSWTVHTDDVVPLGGETESIDLWAIDLYRIVVLMN